MSYFKCKNCGKKMIRLEKECPACGSDNIVTVVKTDNAGNIEKPLKKK